MLRNFDRPIGAIKEATDLVKASGADVLISIGGGSPIDSAKTVAYQIHEATGKWIPSIAVPTTLSVAETTQNAGFTTEEKKKIAVSHPELVPKAVVYDGDIALYTPTNLWTSTGVSHYLSPRACFPLTILDSFSRPRGRAPLPPSGLGNPYQTPSFRSNSGSLHLPSTLKVRS